MSWWQRLFSPWSWWDSELLSPSLPAAIAEKCLHLIKIAELCWRRQNCGDGLCPRCLYMQVEAVAVGEQKAKEQTYWYNYLFHVCSSVLPGKRHKFGEISRENPSEEGLKSYGCGGCCCRWMKRLVFVGRKVSIQSGDIQDLVVNKTNHGL